MIDSVRIGTRGSPLALWQADWVKKSLARLGISSCIEIIRTSGDKHTQGPLADKGGKGLFVKELEEALLQGTIDLAVHSLKDVPTALDPRFHLAAFLPRADVRDCLVWPGPFTHITDLPPGLLLGSCSLRRISQMLVLNPHLKVEPLRGNVETRLEKVRTGRVGATLLAKAGLDRLGISDAGLLHPLPLEDLIPAAGQGIMAIEIDTRQDPLRDLLSQIDCAESRYAAEAERTVVQTLGGTCVSPIGAYASVDRDQLSVQAFVGDHQGRRTLRDSVTGPVHQRVELARGLAEGLLRSGAAEILASCG